MIRGVAGSEDPSLRKKRLRVLFVALFAGLLLHGAGAPAQTADSDPLATAKALKCSFRLMTTASWKGGAVHADVTRAALSLEFDRIDAAEGSAQQVGPFGRLDIIARFSSRTLHLMQVFRLGPLYTTTVFEQESSPGKWQAVHSRHEYALASVPGYTSSPEQYYGECEVTR